VECEGLAHTERELRAQLASSLSQRDLANNQVVHIMHDLLFSCVSAYMQRTGIRACTLACESLCIHVFSQVCACKCVSAV